MKKYGVKRGKFHGRSKLIRVFDTYEQAESWIKENIKEIKINEHYYIDIVKEVRHGTC